MKRKLTHMERHHAGEPRDSSKLFQEMDDSFWEAVHTGAKQGHAKHKSKRAGIPKKKRHGHG